MPSPFPLYVRFLEDCVANLDCDAVEGALGNFARLHQASSYRRPAMAEEFSKTPQVLRGCGQQHFVLCPAQASQAKPVELENTLHVRKSHLDLLRSCGD